MSKFVNVLLVDDNEIDNFINERIITSCKFADNVVVRNSAESALEYLKEIEATEEKIPEIIFLDLNMPIKDGFGFLVDFEKMGEKIRKKSRVIVLSSSISPEDINKASVNPFVYKYLNKPLSEKYLEAVE